MANPFLGVRISPELNEAIAARMKQTGQSKSDIVIAALRSYLGMSSSQQRLEAIEQRLSALEEVAGEVKQFTQIKSLPEEHPAQEHQGLSNKKMSNGSECREAGSRKQKD